jgi:hypothetical protein
MRKISKRHILLDMGAFTVQIGHNPLANCRIYYTLRPGWTRMRVDERLWHCARLSSREHRRLVNLHHLSFITQLTQP